MTSGFGNLRSIQLSYRGKWPTTGTGFPAGTSSLRLPELSIHIEMSKSQSLSTRWSVGLKMVGPKGIEPMTFGLRIRRSTY